MSPKNWRIDTWAKNPALSTTSTATMPTVAKIETIAQTKSTAGMTRSLHAAALRSPKVACVWAELMLLGGRRLLLLEKLFDRHADLRALAAEERACLARVHPLLAERVRLGGQGYVADVPRELLAGLEVKLHEQSDLRTFDGFLRDIDENGPRQGLIRPHAHRFHRWRDR